MGESIKLQEADMEETTKTEELEMEKGTYLKETNMEEAIKSKEKPRVSLREEMEESNKGFPELYNYEVDLGVPAPLRRYWKDMDSSSKDKYEGMHRCYDENREFNMSLFIDLLESDDERTKREFSDLAKENKEVALKELEKCYDEKGRFNYVKFEVLHNEEERYLYEQIRKNERQHKKLLKRYDQNDNKKWGNLFNMGYEIYSDSKWWWE